MYASCNSVQRYPVSLSLGHKFLAGCCCSPVYRSGPMRYGISLIKPPGRRVGTALGRAGSVRVGSGRAGSSRVRSGRAGPGQVGSGRVGSGRVGTHPAAMCECRWRRAGSQSRRGSCVRPRADSDRGEWNAANADGSCTGRPETRTETGRSAGRRRKQTDTVQRRTAREGDWFDFFKKGDICRSQRYTSQRYHRVPVTV